MNLILKNAVPVICIALAASLVLSSCSRTVSSSETTSPASSVVQEQAPSAESEDLAESAASSDESWKADFEKSLWENYNVTPEYYEDLGNGVYDCFSTLHRLASPVMFNLTVIVSRSGIYANIGHGFSIHFDVDLIDAVPPDLRSIPG